MEMLEKIIGKLIGKDKYKSFSMVALANILQKERAPGHVWADYMFLAACYGLVAGDEKTKEYAIARIKEGFPNYDPSERFTWESIPGDVGDKPGSTRFEASRYRFPVIGYMNKFCAAHQDFLFSALSAYFPSAAKMEIIAGKGEGLLEKKGERYSLCEAISIKEKGE